MSKALRIAVEGNIGVGKSTLLPRLRDALPGKWEVLSERVDEDPEFLKLLNDFYQDPNKQIHLQSWITHRRLKEYKQLEGKPENYIFERSFLGELVFCHANLLRHERPEGKFISFFYDVISSLKQCNYDAVVYLKARPETCYKRIKYRSRDAESTIPFEYVEYLGNCYDIHLNEAARIHNIPVVTVDWDNFGQAEVIAEQVLIALDYYGSGQLKHKA